VGELSALFSTSWAEAQAKFRAAAAGAGLTLRAFPLKAIGSDGANLVIDVAALNDVGAAADVVVSTSGVHGVEGFAGSAVQIKMMMDRCWPASSGVLLIHGINAFGMSHLRRTNASNVDLNRNFALATTTHPLYARLRSIAQPTSPPSVLALSVRLAIAALVYGEGTVKQAIAGGQVDDADGIFYAGASTEDEAAVVREIVTAMVPRARRVVAIDLHTGLGPRGEDTLLIRHKTDSLDFKQISEILGFRVTSMSADEGAAYDVAGGLPNALPAWLPDARVDVITQEFGTTSALRTLHAMINENHAWQAGLRAPTHPARQALLRAFHGVDDDAWQAKVVDAGLRVAASLPALLAR
jgi:hypothetical protein